MLFRGGKNARDRTQEVETLCSMNPSISMSSGVYSISLARHTVSSLTEQRNEFLVTFFFIKPKRHVKSFQKCLQVIYVAPSWSNPNFQCTITLVRAVDGGAEGLVHDRRVAARRGAFTRKGFQAFSTHKSSKHSVSITIVFGTLSDARQREG